MSSQVSSSSKSPETERFARTRRDHALETAADYVELIRDLIATRGEARTVDIAERLGVSAVTVSKTLQRLQRDGLITTQPYRSVFLTESGRDLAEKFREKHEVVREFLLLHGVPAEVADIDAEGIEHHVSDATLEAMRRFNAGQK